MCKLIFKFFPPVFLCALAMLPLSCAEEGEDDSTESQEIDCGSYGDTHGDHCHCHPGYMFDGATCVMPDQVTDECKEHEGEEDAGEPHDHAACRCPPVGECHCDNGTVETYGAYDYCLPELH
jgi:hypothetical protein